MRLKRVRMAKRGSGIWSKSFISLFFVNGLLSLGQMMMNVLIALYADSLGADASMVGFTVSAFAYTALALKFVSAPAIDAFSRKRILIGSLFVLALSYLMMSASSNIFMLVFARLLQGSAMAFTTTTCLAMATDTLPPDHISSGIGYFSVAQAACMAVGPMIGLNLAGTFGYNAAFATGGVLMLVGTAAVFLVKEPPHKRRPFKLSLGSMFAKETILPAFLAGLLAIAFCNVNSFLALYAGERGVGDDIGWYFTVNAILMLFSRPLVGRMADEHGLVKVILPSMCSFALSFFIISRASSLPLFLLAAVFAAFGYGAAGPMIQAFCMKSVPPERRGAGSSAYFIGMDVGNLVGPVIAGHVVGLVGYQLMWDVMIIPIGLAFLFVLAFRKRITEVDRRAAASASDAEEAAPSSAASGEGPSGEAAEEVVGR